MEYGYVLLGLIKIYKEVTGYELSVIIRDLNRYFLSYSLAYIYPVLKKLYHRGLIMFTNTPITNRPDKKTYQITPLGEQILEDWLKTPIKQDLDFRSFLVKMEFFTLMDNDTIIAHVDREILFLEQKIKNMNQMPDYYKSGKLDQKSNEILIDMSQLLIETEILRLNRLKKWRQIT